VLDARQGEIRTGKDMGTLAVLKIHKHKNLLPNSNGSGVKRHDSWGTE